MHPIVASLLSTSSTLPVIRQGLRRTPHKNSIVNHKDSLSDGYKARLEELNAKPLPVVLNEGHPFPKFNEKLSQEQVI